MPVRLPALPCLLLSVAAISGHAATPAITPAPASATNWNAVARQDMQFAIDTLRNSHAGVAGGRLDASAPLDNGAQAALIEASQAQTERDYKRAMVRFIASFGDPHTGIGLKLKTEAWTGVVLDRIDGQYRVIWSEPGWPNALPPAGAVAQSCDGVWVGTYLKSSVAPFSTHSAEYAAAASDHARSLMFDNGLGWVPKRCTFTLPGGGTQRFDLPLRPVAEIGAERITEVLGEPTKGYSPYGEIGTFDLPSGNGVLAIASALYDSRQATREPFVPDLPYQGNMADDAALTTWVARTLARTKPGQQPHP